MPLSPNEIRDRALKFSRDWQDAKAERAEAQTFWNEFFHVFGIERRRVATFEQRVSRLDKALEDAGAKTEGGFIDLFWPGTLIAEHKSRGKDLDSAFQQALDYTDYLKRREHPRYVIVSDFARIRLHDLEEGTEDEIPLSDLHKHVRLFGFMAGYSPLRIREQDPVNIQAAERMAKLYDRLKESGYPEHDLKVFLVRVLFCLFADDTTLFEPKGAFNDYLENNTREDGSDLGATLNWMFEILNVAPDQRQKQLDERIAALPYVNGKLFAEHLRTPAFDARGRETLLECCGLDWGRISPAVFGSLFQSVMDKDARRQLGAHYTSEENILKVVKPLFLDALRNEFDKAKKSPKKLFELHKKLGALKFLDPACGCGNFLVIAYRELRLLELDILRAVLKVEQETGQRHLDVFELIHVNVDQFYGIEIEEFPAQIAQVALWLTDHQMNLKVSEEFGHYYRRLPLEVSPTIVCGNALEIDWEDVVPAAQVDFILGNPPFGGKQYQKPEQKEDMRRIFQGVKGAGNLDYVAAWYLRAVKYLRGEETGQRALAGLWQGRAPKDHVKVGFVSTNSITQGEQVAVLWGELLKHGVKIHFAHRTFQWQSEARGKAAVHCVIIGFALFDAEPKYIYDYPNIKGEPVKAKAKNINPYLVDAADVLMTKRRQPLADVPPMRYGSKPVDGGYLIFTDDEKEAFLSQEPNAEHFFRPFMGADELLYDYRRWCLWLKDVDPVQWRSLPLVKAQVEKVRAFRLKSKKKPTREMADYPTLFAEDRQPDGDYLALPEVSSETREYLPIAYLGADIIASNKIYKVENAGKYVFGFLCSKMHFSWMSYTSGKLESRFQYSSSLTYNNFPWPKSPSEKKVQQVEAAAQAVLDARAQFPDASLADLYDPVAMPTALRRAHTALDKAVDTAYGRKKFHKEADRVAFLFKLYQHYTNAQ